MDKCKHGILVLDECTRCHIRDDLLLEDES